MKTEIEIRICSRTFMMDYRSVASHNLDQIKSNKIKFKFNLLLLSNNKLAISAVSLHYTQRCRCVSTSNNNRNCQSIFCPPTNSTPLFFFVVSLPLGFFVALRPIFQLIVPHHLAACFCSINEMDVKIHFAPYP